MLRKRTREVKRGELSSEAPRDKKRKRFKCSHENCNKSYASNHSLRRHQGDSHGPKLVCNYCLGNYTKSGLPKHQKRCKKRPDRVVDNVDEEEGDESGEEEEDERMGRQLLDMID